jgi:uncharacterized membrane protein
MTKKLIGVILFILSFILISFLPNNSYAVTDYVINSYDIDVKVNENNTFDITETITANFYMRKHGIIRTIPLKNTIERLDGSKSTNRVKITNLQVNNKYSKSNSNGNLAIKIGNQDTYVTGLQKYIIKYTYDIGADPVKDADEFYYNLIGNEWDTSISNISFSITMPKEFDASSLGFSSGRYGYTDNNSVSYSVNGNTISGIYTDTLPAGNGLTIRLTLPDNYFVGAHDNKTDYYIIIGICLFIVFIAFVLWLLFGRDKPVIETVEFYPPGGYNSAELAFLYKGETDDKAIVSLLIYLASKGYLKIEEIENKALFASTKDFIIYKLKEYDGTNEIEKLFFNGLFRTRSAVTSSDLTNRFYITVNRIKKLLNKKENKTKIFDKKSLSLKKLIIPMMLIIFVLITAKSFYDAGMLSELPVALIFPGIGFSLMISILTSSGPISTKIFIVIWGLLFGGIPTFLIILPVIFSNSISAITYLIGILCIIVLYVFRKIILKRTPFGLEILGKIKGFKRFLETAEKDQLEAMVEKEPEYFYNILPYTYALGVSDKWVEQFENIAVEPPSWYYSSTAFSVHSFGTFMTSVNTSMTSRPSSSSSGGSSGGGFSGGGSGGGGGSSW